MKVSPEKNTVTELLRSAGKIRMASEVVWAVLFGGMALAALSALLGNHFSEALTARLLLAGFAILTASVAWIWRKSAKRASIKGLCDAFQRECPDDRNALDAAVDLERHQEGLTEFQSEYLRELRKRYLSDGGASLKKSPALCPRWRPLGLALSAAILCGLCFAGRSAWLRLWNYSFGGEAIAISELPESVAVHSDLLVTAKAVRYGGEEMWLESVIDGVRRREKMSRDISGEWRITLYDMTEKARFRALTRDGSSKWRSIGCHIPPVPESISLDVVSPEYSGLPPAHYDEFQDVEVLEGGQINVDCRMPQGQTWELRAEDGRKLRSLPVVGGRYTPRYVNGRISSEGNPFQVTVIADEVPVIEMVSPEEDSEIAPGRDARVVAMVSDDFGVTEVSLRYVVDDGQEKSVTLEMVGEGANVSVDAPVNFGEVEPGQVITGWLVAKDNRTPQAHIARGPLFFLTVIPPQGEDGDGDSGQSDEQSGEKQEMAVNDLIAESKRLLRETLDLLDRETFLEPDAYQQEKQTLSRDLRSLSAAVTGRQVAVAMNAGMEELPKELADFFKAASEALDVAGDLVEAGAVVDSRRPQQSALAQLTRLAWMLMQNTPKISQGSQGDSKNDGQKNQGKQESEVQKGDRNFDIEELQNALEQVRRLRKRQQEILRDLNAANASDERSLAEAVNGVATRIAAIASAARAVPPLRDASRELLGASTALGNGDVANGNLRGHRGEMSLGTAEELLEEALRKESREQLERLARKADELAKEQRSLAEQSRQYGESGAGKEEKNAAKESQKNLEKRSQEFKDEAVASLRSLARQYPNASDKLAEALGSRISEQVQKAQTRANNALLYGRFDRAQESQNQAAEALEQWRDELAAANDAIPRFTPEELQAALEELQQRAQALAQSAEFSDMQARQSEAAQTLQRYADQFRSEELNALGDAVAQGSREEALSALQTARALLREELAKLMGAGVLNAVRQSAPPPKKYRPQTQEYFRRLGDGK